MSLEKQILEILNDFEHSHSDKIIQALDEVQNHLKNELTREYLQGKIKAAKESTTESDKKKLCKNLLPYLDWYVQGI